MLEDYVVIASVMVIVVCGVILGTFLSRYASLVRQVDASSRLARDLWESMNTRFAVIDSRVVDLMAKSEIFSSRITSQGVQATIQPARTSDTPVSPSQGDSNAVPVVAAVTKDSEGTDTELRVLRLLSEGARSSAEIKDVLGRSREHTSRLMKGLYDRGLVVRNDRKKPYVYEITATGKSYVAN